MKRFVQVAICVQMVFVAISAMVAFAFAGTAAATPPTPVSGSETITSFTSTLLRVADGNSFFANAAAGTITGSFTGTFTAEFTTLIRPSGEINASDGTFTCTCSVAGRSGTFTNRFEGTGAVGPPFTLVVHSETIDGTGGLVGLHVNVTVQSVGATISYSGTSHFDP